MKGSGAEVWNRLFHVTTFPDGKIVRFSSHTRQEPSPQSRRAAGEAARYRFGRKAAIRFAWKAAVPHSTRDTASAMSEENVEALRPVYEDKMGNEAYPLFPRDSRYTPPTWSGDGSGEFPDQAGVVRDPELRSERLRRWLDSWEGWRVEAEEYISAGEFVVGALPLYGSRQGERSRRGRPGSARLEDARRQGRTAGRSSPIASLIKPALSKPPGFRSRQSGEPLVQPDLAPCVLCGRPDPPVGDPSVPEAQRVVKRKRKLDPAFPPLSAFGERHEDAVGTLLNLPNLDPELLEVLEPLLREGEQSLVTPARAAPVSIVELDFRMREFENGFQVTAIPGVDRPLDDPSFLGVRCGRSIA